MFVLSVINLFYISIVASKCPWSHSCTAFAETVKINFLSLVDAVLAQSRLAVARGHSFALVHFKSKVLAVLNLCLHTVDGNGAFTAVPYKFAILLYVFLKRIVVDVWVMVVACTAHIYITWQVNTFRVDLLDHEAITHHVYGPRIA